jgi:hypothetical protein
MLQWTGLPEKYGVVRTLKLTMPLMINSEIKTI